MYGHTYLTTFAVLGRAHGEIYIYKFKLNDLKFAHFYTIKVTDIKDNPDEILDTFPF